MITEWSNSENKTKPAPDPGQMQSFADALSQSEKRLANAQKIVHIGNWDLDTVNNLLYWSDEIYRIFGISRENFTPCYETFYNTIHPDDREAWEVHRDSVLAGSTSMDMEHRIVLPTGEVRYVHELGERIVDRNNRVIRLSGTVQDITERRASRDELENLSLIAKQTSNPVIVIDISGNIIWVNNAFERTFGYGLQEVVGKKPGNLLEGPETDRETVRYLRGKMEKKELFDCELVKYSKSGQKYWMHVQGQPIFDAAGKCTKFFTIQNDITERKIAQERIKASEKDYRYLFHQNPMPMWIFDPETLYFLEVNEAAICQYGYSAEEFRQMRITDIRPPSSVDKLKKVVADRMDSQGIMELGVWTHLKKNGESIFVEITSHNIDYKDKKAVLVLANNVTERVLLQSKLSKELVLKHREITEAVVEAQEKERLEIGKELHDNVNQLLGAARLYITAARDYKQEIDAMLDQSATLIACAIEEVRKLSKALTGPGMENLRLCGAVEDLAEQIMFAKQINISLDKEIFYEEDLNAKVKLNIFRIIQEQFNNILKHANASEVHVSMRRDPGKIKLMIRDDGEGFDMAQKRNGIGITNIINRAALNNGKVIIKSSPGNGCTLEAEFAIELPKEGLCLTAFETAN